MEKPSQEISFADYVKNNKVEYSSGSTAMSLDTIKDLMGVFYGKKPHANLDPFIEELKNIQQRHNAILNPEFPSEKLRDELQALQQQSTNLIQKMALYSSQVLLDDKGILKQDILTALTVQFPNLELSVKE